MAHVHGRHLINVSLAVTCATTISTTTTITIIIKEFKQCKSIA